MCVCVWNAHVFCVCTPVYTCSGVYVHTWGVHVWVGVHMMRSFKMQNQFWCSVFFFSFQGIFKIKGTDCCGAEIFQV